MISSKEKYIQIFSKLTELQSREWLEVNYDNRAIGRIKELKSLAERKQEVEDITEAYFEIYVKFPLPRFLDMLSNYILADYIKEKNSGKKKEDNAFQTDRQMRSRWKMEIKMESEKIDHFHAKKQFNIPQQRVTQNKKNDK